MSTTEPTTEFEEPWPNYSTPQSKALMANESWGRTGFAFYHKANRREMAEALERVERQAGEAALSQLATVVEALRKLHDQVNAEQDIPCVGVSGGCRPAIILADLSKAATEHDERIRQAALSQFTPERIAEALDGVLPRMAFIQYAEPLYGLDWEPDAYYLRVATEVLAALTEKPQETE